MTTLTLKFRTPTSSSLPKIKINLSKQRPTHIVQLHDFHSSDTSYVASPARHSHTISPTNKGKIACDIETAREVC